MTTEQINEHIINVTPILKFKYRSFTECVWNENDKSFIYNFNLAEDAEQFKSDCEFQGVQFRIIVKHHHANWSTVSELRD